MKSASEDLEIQKTQPSSPSTSLPPTILGNRRLRRLVFAAIIFIFTAIAFYTIEIDISYVGRNKVSPKIETVITPPPARFVEPFVETPPKSDIKPSWSWNRNELCVPEPSRGLDEYTIANEREKWQAFMNDLEIPEMTGPVKRGIVFTGFSGIHVQIKIAVSVLRRMKCKLPIEIWYYGKEFSQAEIDDLRTLEGVTTRDISKIPSRIFALKKKDRMWEMKGASIIYSSFDQVLFLDADNLALRNPEFLFDSPAFKETGALFWKDFTKAGKNNAIWKILNIPCTREFEQESGQILIDKTRPDTLKALYLASYMQREGEFYFKLFWGDKETFRLAWRAIGAPYHLVRPHLGIVGTTVQGQFCGHTMLQFSPMWIPALHGPAPDNFSDPEDPMPLFLHANLFKYTHRTENGKVLYYLTTGIQQSHEIQFARSNDG